MCRDFAAILVTWGLRDYGLEPLVWGGNPDGCPSVVPGEVAGDHEFFDDLCRHSPCNAWCGSLGLEPTPELFVEHIVEVFRAVKRVLRNDGVCWVNMGDCYAGGPNGRSAADVKALGNDDRTFRDKPFGTAGSGLKPKDLCMMPARVALALQADGWWLRSMMPWVKRNSMPESVTDRPASAIEYMFLLSKSARYFFDIEAVRQPMAPESAGRYAYDFGGAKNEHLKAGDNPRAIVGAREPTTGRNPRNTDLFYESLANPYGLISNGDGEPLALDVNPAPYPEAHFATFPPALVVPLIKAGTSEKGCCPECGAPWRRETEQSVSFQSGSGRAGNKPKGKHAGKEQSESGDYDIRMGPVKQVKTTGWRPSCECGSKWGKDDTPHPPVPATILDCFGGAGTVGLVADRLGRDAILIEAKPEYADMAAKRIADDGGMFAEVG